MLFVYQTSYDKYEKHTNSECRRSKTSRYYSTKVKIIIICWLFTVKKNNGMLLIVLGVLTA